MEWNETKIYSREKVVLNIVSRYYIDENARKLQVVISDGMDIDPVEAVIEACFDFADIIRASGVDVRVEAVTVARDGVETGTRDPIMVSDDEDTPPMVPEVIHEPAQEGAAGCTYETLGDLVQRFHDHTQVIPVHHIHAIEGVQREQGHRIVRVDSAVTTLTERVAELERDNMRLRGTASVESQRVDRLQRGMCCIQRELRQIRRLRFDRVRLGDLRRVLEAMGQPSLEMLLVYAAFERKMPNTRSGASMTPEEFEELVTRRVAEEKEAREATRTLEPLNENRDEQEGENGGFAETAGFAAIIFP
ncbi:hypothetical protein Tco_0216347 [Tanacetum coccineum]